MNVKLNKRNKYIKYTKAELQSYVQDTNSCVKQINSTEHLGLPPWALGDLASGIHHFMSKKIGKYNKNLGGIILDYRDTKVLDNKSIIRHDTPELHINIQTNFYVFKPEIDSVITGTIRHIALHHIGVIIYRVFNVSIRLNDTKKTDLQVKQEVKFRIKNFNFQDALPYIEGELIPELNSAATDSDCADSGISTGDRKLIGKSTKFNSDSESSSDEETIPAVTKTEQNSTYNNINSKSVNLNPPAIPRVNENNSSSSDSSSESEKSMPIKREEPSPQKIAIKQEEMPNSVEDDPPVVSKTKTLPKKDIKTSNSPAKSLSDDSQKRSASIERPRVKANSKRQREDSTSSNSTDLSDSANRAVKRGKPNDSSDSFIVPTLLQKVSKKIDFSDSDSSTPKKRSRKIAEPSQTTESLVSNLINTILSEKSSSETESSSGRIHKKAKRSLHKTANVIVRKPEDESSTDDNVAKEKNSPVKELNQELEVKKKIRKKRATTKNEPVQSTSDLVANLMRSFQMNADVVSSLQQSSSDGNETIVKTKKQKKNKKEQKEVAEVVEQNIASPSTSNETKGKSKKKKIVEDESVMDTSAIIKEKKVKKNVTFNDTVNISVIDPNTSNESLNDTIFNHSNILSTPLLSSTMREMPKEKTPKKPKEKKPKEEKSKEKTPKEKKPKEKTPKEKKSKEKSPKKNSVIVEAGPTTEELRQMIIKQMLNQNANV